MGLLVLGKVSNQYIFWIGESKVQVEYSLTI
jgi:hypothetical protein